MKHSTLRSVAICVALGAILACGPNGCDSDNSGTTVPPFESMALRGFWPCCGLAGTPVTLYRTPNIPAIFILGSQFSTASSATSTSVVLTVHPAANTGSVSASDTYGRTMGLAPDNFHVEADDPIAEIEPNEDINGADATPMGPRTQGTGTLANPADRDHFRRVCFMVGARYSVTVTPQVTNTVFVNGVAIPLDGAGRGEFTAQDRTLLFGMTGGTGAYTMTIGFVSP